MSITEQVQVKILDKRIGNEWKLPSYATAGAAGFDVCACLDGPITLKAGETLLISAGISIFLDNCKYAAILLPRSGLGHKHGIVLGNLVGLFDSDYQGPVMMSCWNRGTHDFIINPGDRIAQMVIIPVIRAEFIIVDDFDKTKRGEDGFGSTGVSNA